MTFPASIPAPRAILFDLDGTLADTAPDLAAAVNWLRTERGLAERRTTCCVPPPRLARAA